MGDDVMMAFAVLVAAYTSCGVAILPYRLDRGAHVVSSEPLNGVERWTALGMLVLLLVMTWPAYFNPSEPDGF